MVKQKERENLLGNLSGYKPRNPDKIKSKEAVLENAAIFFQGRNLFMHFKKVSFPYLKKKCLNIKNGEKKKDRKKMFLQKKDQKLLQRKKRV